MNVKGIVYLTGKTNLIEAFGEERWNSFIPKLTAKDKFFSNVIMSVTPIPIEKFILYLDVMIEEYFNNDMMQYVTIGKAAAKFAVSPEGPYKSYLLTKDINQFAESVMPKIYSTYFDEGKPTAKFENNIVHFKSPDLNSNIHTSSTLLWVTFSKSSKFSGRKQWRKRSGA